MQLSDDLAAILTPGQVTENQSIREQHSHDESYQTPRQPDVVVFAQSADDVAKVLRYANEHRVPVVPFAAGTSLEGHAIPVRGGISLDLTRMDRILEVRPEDFLVRVEPGVSKNRLNETLRRHGLFFAVDPGADATLGGMAATNASGTTTVRYGAMRDQVRALTVVLADGRVIHTGSLAAKSSSGYNLNGLFVGSEGTLGVFTELWLRVFGLPETVYTTRAVFPSLQSAVRAATAVMGAGIPVARMEFVDERMMRGINRFKDTDYPESPTLLFEFHGSSEGLRMDVDAAREIAREEGCTLWTPETTEEGRRRLWDARHSAAPAYTAQFPGKRNMSTDVCVPFSALADAVSHAREAAERAGIPAGMVGHLGDGNFHMLLPVDPSDADEMARAEAVNAEIVQAALARGGTCTGEHGVGLGKRKYQAKEHGEALLIMQSIKRLLDPNGILNPDKLVDP